MSGYEVAFYPDALKDIKRLDGSQRKIVLKAIEKIRTNPLPQNEVDLASLLETRRVRI